MFKTYLPSERKPVLSSGHAPIHWPVSRYVPTDDHCALMKIIRIKSNVRIDFQ